MSPCIIHYYFSFLFFLLLLLFLTLIFSLQGLLAEMSGNKSDRSVSPAAISEESRRDLLARQHRALYGNDSPAFFPPANFADDGSRPDSQTAITPSSTAGVRGPSPRGIDPFGLSQASGQTNPDHVAQVATTNPAATAFQSPPRANNTSSPGAGPIYGKFDDQPVTSTSSPGRTDSPSSIQTASKSITGPVGSVGPIGTRPIQQGGISQVGNPVLNKRSTTPLTSPLSFGFTPSDAAASIPRNERLASSASNPQSTVSANGRASMDSSAASVGFGWGTGSGVWGSKNGLGVQASVWG